ncbi:hydroxymethylpyrimidine/phosphomethylpyrimidine kinase [Thermogymnomonas acidicola]|uniref:Hydroxymethylpyrimidine/phosphomethylpyrimidine kinase n=1 Tax=Thermogymnomonas acidicola TaxID=399579 RepID=A0AA37BS34_9ARCH|nr:bifunctional hydroxymethylpyrimidine kinase/phosphomethylpyrimidine kinase [Thermogymnomonas acidicola]GGM76849.1 hydroxymethylpyrimidine/phosphomethylpyrimidine kinase [Thermogymnomonas acidicola]
MSVPRCLTVAGSDSGGGAGIQADLKTFTAFRAFGMSVIVALTAQNSCRVVSIHPVPVKFIEDQMDAVLTDIGTDAAKTGMLFSSEIIWSVAGKFREYGVRNIVVDPVMVSKSGARLLQESAVNSLKSNLLPQCTLVTPNVPEAEVISGIRINGEEDMVRAGEKIRDEFGCSVLMKGGHTNLQEVPDILVASKVSRFTGTRIETRNTHGTGDTLSSAICACLAMGKSLEQSVRIAKSYLQKAIEASFPMGQCFGSLGHFWNCSLGNGL